jgi:hypothetical protein
MLGKDGPNYMGMTTIRENIFRVTFDEIGSPVERGYYDLPNGGKVLIDLADMRYIQQAKSGGYDPIFFVSRTKSLEGDFVVVGRQWKA